MADYNILWQSSTPISSLPAHTKAIEEHAEKILGRNFELHIRGVPSGSMDLHFSYVQYLNDHHIIKSLLKAEEEGYDAVAMGSFSTLFLKKPGRLWISPLCPLQKRPCCSPAL